MLPGICQVSINQASIYISGHQSNQSEEGVDLTSFAEGEWRSICPHIQLCNYINVYSTRGYINIDRKRGFGEFLVHRRRGMYDSRFGVGW